MSNEKGFDAEADPLLMRSHCLHDDELDLCHQCKREALQRAFDAGRRSGVEDAAKSVESQPSKFVAPDAAAREIRALIGGEKKE